MTGLKAPTNSYHCVGVPQDGFFQLPCTTRPKAKFSGKNSYLNTWVSVTSCRNNATDDTSSGHRQPFLPADANVRDVSGLTLAVQRAEYANIYFVMVSLYDAFQLMLTFNAHPKNVTLLIVDAHPSSGLDVLYDNLFARVVRAAHLPAPTRFAAMGWLPLTYNSPLRQMRSKHVLHLEEFREFVLQGHGLGVGRSLNCSSLRLLFVWRRDYVAHPRNRAGVVGRKILNEEELLTAVQEAMALNGDRVEGHQMDALPVREQLRKVSESDVLLGMHGAGLAHALLLPRHGALVELYPCSFPVRTSFRSIAAWRGLRYRTWRNKDPRLERPTTQHTYIPPDAVVGLVRELRRQMCG